jgi:hypothetical protein
VVPADLGIVRSAEELLAMDSFPTLRWVWPQSAKRQEKAGKLRAILDQFGGLCAWQEVGTPAMLRGQAGRVEYRAPSPEKSTAMPIFDRSSCSISPSEMNVYAGRHFKNGGSRTAGLNDERRAQRKYSDKPLSEAEILAGRRQKFGTPPAEDFVERVVAKVNAFEPSRAAA